MSDGNEKPRSRKGLLEDLSMSQVLAGALAAVTSVALSSRIGIAGSLIGVAVASVVSTVASQLYRGMLSRANDKLREFAGTDDAQADALEGPNPYGLDHSDVEMDRTVVAHGPAQSSEEHARIAPASLRAAAQQRRQRELHRRVMVAAVVSSLAAVAASAGVVLIATNGEGLGQRTGAAATTETATTAETHESETSPATGHAETASAQPKTPAQEGASTGSSASGSESSSDTASGSGDASGSGQQQGTSSDETGASTQSSGSTAAGEATTGDGTTAK